MCETFQLHTSIFATFSKLVHIPDNSLAETLNQLGPNLRLAMVDPLPDVVFVAVVRIFNLLISILLTVSSKSNLQHRIFFLFPLLPDVLMALTFHGLQGISLCHTWVQMFAVIFPGNTGIDFLVNKVYTLSFVLLSRFAERFNFGHVFHKGRWTLNQKKKVSPKNDTFHCLYKNVYVLLILLVLYTLISSKIACYFQQVIRGFMDCRSWSILSKWDASVQDLKWRYSWKYPRGS